MTKKILKSFCQEKNCLVYFCLTQDSHTVNTTMRSMFSPTSVGKKHFSPVTMIINLQKRILLCFVAHPVCSSRISEQKGLFLL